MVLKIDYIWVLPPQHVRVPTHNNYKIGFRTTDTDVLSEIVVDVLAEHAPKFISLNQTEYSWNDVIVITGENLTEIIRIPSNGSYYIVEKSGYYDYTLNNTKTTISLILNYRSLFPIYYNSPEERIITFQAKDGRIGESFTTIFN